MKALTTAKTKTPALPTYTTIAAVLEKQTGSGLKLVGWTFARAALIIPPFFIFEGLRREWKKVVAAGLLASTMISIFAMIRIYTNEYEISRAYFQSRRWAQKKLRAPRVLKKIA